MSSNTPSPAPAPISPQPRPDLNRTPLTHTPPAAASAGLRCLYSSEVMTSGHERGSKIVRTGSSTCQ
eukprot:scaffold22337_cov112-Isochrysis_galbana.AAC.3